MNPGERIAILTEMVLIVQNSAKLAELIAKANTLAAAQEQTIASLSKKLETHFH